uniref:Uncharacterized protein n=2 Tax=Zea mays TaxID=4577 RepID=A0A804MF33_MAIZE
MVSSEDWQFPPARDVDGVHLTVFSWVLVPRTSKRFQLKDMSWRSKDTTVNGKENHDQEISCIVDTMLLCSILMSFLFSSDDAKDVVHYQTISPKSLAKSVLEEGGWSNFMFSREDTQNNIDVAIVFIGSKLQSSDISKDKQVDPALADTLKPWSLEQKKVVAVFSRNMRPLSSGVNEGRRLWKSDIT